MVCRVQADTRKRSEAVSTANTNSGRLDQVCAPHQCGILCRPPAGTPAPLPLPPPPSNPHPLSLLLRSPARLYPSTWPHSFVMSSSAVAGMRFLLRTANLVFDNCILLLCTHEVHLHSQLLLYASAKLTSTLFFTQKVFLFYDKTCRSGV